MSAFRDRVDAGERLVARLVEQRFERPVVLGIPRGGVPVAAPVARALHAPLGVMVARKVGAPYNPELAIGATTASGAAVIDWTLAARTGASEPFVRAEIARQVVEAKRREDVFDGRRRPALAGRDVILVDDGIATGATTLAAVRGARAEKAARVFVAVPVGSPDSMERLAPEVDEIICLVPDPSFRAVGAYYEDFTQVTDAEVKAILDDPKNVATDVTMTG